MYLEVSVHLYGAQVAAESWTLTQLDQAEGIGAKVGRVVRDFVRTRPIRKGGTRLQLDVRATWHELEPRAESNGRPKRRRKKAEANAAK